LFRECLNNKILIFLPPSLHDWLRIRINNGLYVVLDILLLSTLIVEGYSARGKRIEDISYVNFWAACHTYMEMRDMKVDELLHKLKNLVTR
jgi:hypothetical protein